MQPRPLSLDIAYPDPIFYGGGALPAIFIGIAIVLTAVLLILRAIARRERK